MKGWRRAHMVEASRLFHKYFRKGVFAPDGTQEILLLAVSEKYLISQSLKS